MANKITTVCGDIKLEELGVTTMHEHTILKTLILIKAVLGNGTVKIAHPEAADGNKSRQTGKLPRGASLGMMRMMFKSPVFKTSSLNYYTQELIEFKKAGGQSLLDGTPIGGRVDMRKIQKLSRNSGVNIIACTGFYVEPVIPKKLVQKGEQAMSEALVKDIELGIGNSGVKPGFVKCALSMVRDDKVSEIEMMSLRACAKTAKQYGMSLHIHAAYPLTYGMILGVADLLTNEIGIKPERVLMLHIDSCSIRSMNPNIEVNQLGYNPLLAFELLQRGFNIDLDGWGSVIHGKERGLADDESRFQLLKEMTLKGFAEQICLGHDIVNKMSGKQAGAYGYTRFPTYVPKRMEEDGMDETVYHKIAVKNPARILAF
jgi:phosphotriesterase-related protein